MALAANESTKALLTVVGSLSVVEADIDTAHDNIVFKVNADADGPVGLYHVNSSNEWEHVGGASSVPVILGRHAKTTISNTTSETDILDFTVPADTLGTDKQLRVHFGGLITNNSGGTATVRFRVYLGSTVLWNDITGSLATSGNGRGLWMTLLLSNEGATDAQDLSGLVVIGGTGAANTGRGDIGSDEIASHAAIDGMATEDTTSDRTFRVSVQMSTANANFSVVRYRAISEVL